MKAKEKLPQYLVGFLDYVDKLQDHRAQDNLSYSMAEIVFLIVVAIFAGCDGWADIERFGKDKLFVLKEYLPYKNGAPSDDTLRRFLRLLDPKAFADSLQAWLQNILPTSASMEEVIALDGKTLRGSATDKKKALHTVSAYITSQGITLATCDVDGKSNEIAAIPELLNVIDVEDAMVTLDAMGCQEEIIAQIVDKKGDYLIAIKGNQRNSYQEVIDYFSLLDTSPAFAAMTSHDQYVTEEKNRGRFEKRECTLLCGINDLGKKNKWKGLESIVRIRSSVTYKEKTSQEERYYISSRACSAKKMLDYARRHWACEAQHYILDVSFAEDDSRIRLGNAPMNVGLIRRFVLSVCQKMKPKRLSFRLFRKSAGWNDDLLRDFIERITNQY